MAKTTVPIELSSTPSIVDNGNATAITIDSSQNVGIGTSPTEKLTVNGALAITGALVDDRTSTGAIDFSGGITRFVSYGASGVGGIFAFRTASGGASSAERMRIDSSGNVGIGNTSLSPLYWPNGSTGGLFLQAGALLSAYNASTNLSQNWYYNAGEKFISNGGASRYVQSGQEHIWSSSTTVNSSGAGASLTWSERMRINSSGHVFMPSLNSTASGYNDLAYNTANGQLIYRTSSQRYKENIQDLPSSLDKVNALRPVTFDEIATGNSCFGLIAEEVFEQIPELVSLREIEGYDEPQPDSVTYSMLSVHLLKAIQEQQAIIEDLKARITALEGN